ncbi:MAG TPA: glycosyltransferase family 4 protein [Terriglobales bacterium]|nr:glycosyltransferase family 4 protein [Terriglobales bacterium]
MRVLTFTSLFPNSCQPEHGIFIYQRMAHFAQRPGNYVEVVAPIPYVPSWLRGAAIPSRLQHFASVPRTEKIGGIRVHHPRYPLIPKISMAVHGWLMYNASRKLVKSLVTAAKFDLIDGHYVYPDGYAAVRLAKDVGLPAFVTTRGTDMNLFPEIRTVMPKIRWTLGNVAGGIGVSSKLRELMLNNGLPSAKSTVIGNGIDTERFFPVDQAEARKRLDLPRDQKILVSVAALKRHKGFPLLIPAVQKLREKGLNVLLLLIGDGEGADEAKKMASELGIADRVRFLGIVPNQELQNWYSAADASVLASTREGWPNVLLESMACGTPVLATNIGGIPEVLNSEKLGILTEPNVESVCTGLCRALSTSWDREAIAEYGRSRSWDAVAAEVDAFFALKLSESMGCSSG